jgi:hypothetical protein
MTDPATSSAPSPASSPASSNLWAQKPWWCQPWSIVLTGIGIMGGSWLLFHTFWLTLPAIGAIAVWWWYFLWVVPRFYATQATEQTTE